MRRWLVLSFAACSSASDARICVDQRQRRDTSYFSRIAAAGAVSCSVTHTMVLPLDAIKMKMQSELRTGPLAAVSSVLSSSKGPLAMRALFTGSVPTSIGYFLQGAAKFGGYELLKQRAFAAASQVDEDLARVWRLPIMLASAASAELFATFLLCPLEVMKVRMQTDAAAASHGMLRLCTSIVRSEGVGALYKGLAPIAMRQLPYTSVKLVCFELFLGMAMSMMSGLQMQEEDMESIRPFVVLGCGLAGGALAAVVSQPADVLLTRLCGTTKMSSLTECVISSSTMEHLRYMRSLGLNGLFAGLAPRVAMVSCMTAVQFLLYDAARRQLNCID